MMYNINAASNSGEIFGKAKSALLVILLLFLSRGKLRGVEVAPFDLPRLLDGYMRRQIHTPKQKDLQC